MLDRVVQSAAEAAGVPFVALGIRHTDSYEFIATHGMPMTHYIDRVPASVLGADLFAREVEVADLQKQPQFVALGIVPIAKTWRYGGNVPVKLQQPLSDGGVIALSAADAKLRELGGRIISMLRRHAEFVSDMIWLSQQVQISKFVDNPLQVVGSVLQAAAASIEHPICVVDGHRRILGQSLAFGPIVRGLGGELPKVGQLFGGPWLGSETERKIDTALAETKALRMVPVPNERAGEFILDVFPFSFATVGRFAVISLADNTPLRDRFRADSAVHAPSVGSWSGPAGPLSRFLIETLIVGERLQHRNDTRYVGVRRWRSPIRKYQIAALRALKEELPDEFVQTIADEMVGTIRHVYGSPDNCVVVPVPCGHSGENCLAHRLANMVAERLDVPAIHAFAPIDGANGSSHPRKNGRRAAMQLRETIDRPVILVDDVGTSGSHIDEAATLLRKSAPSVWPVVWIAA